jgi:flagellar hook assembly protein FlgD
MSVSGIDSTTTSMVTKNAASETGFSKTDFLNILTAQLKYQDPMNPADANEFMSQLAQLTQVESLQNIQDSLDALANKSDANQWLSAIGKKMEVKDTAMSVGDQIVISPSNGYDQITLTMKASDGTTVTKKFTSGDALTFTAESDSYTITGLSATKDGESVDCNLNLFRVIRGVQTADSGTVLIAGDGTTYNTSSVNMIIQ